MAVSLSALHFAGTEIREAFKVRGISFHLSLSSRDCHEGEKIIIGKLFSSQTKETFASTSEKKKCKDASQGEGVSARRISLNDKKQLLSVGSTVFSAHCD